MTWKERPNPRLSLAERAKRGEWDAARLAGRGKIGVPPLCCGDFGASQPFKARHSFSGARLQESRIAKVDCN